MATGHLYIGHDLAQKADDVIRIFLLFFLLCPPITLSMPAAFIEINTFLLTRPRMLCVRALIWPPCVSVVARHRTETVRLPHHRHRRRSALLLLQLLPRHSERRYRQERLHRGCKSTNTITFYALIFSSVYIVMHASLPSLCLGHQRADSRSAHQPHPHAGLHHFQEVVEPAVRAPPLFVPARLRLCHLQDLQQAGGTFHPWMYDVIWIQSVWRAPIHSYESCSSASLGP